MIAEKAALDLPLGILGAYLYDILKQHDEQFVLHVSADLEKFAELARREWGVDFEFSGSKARNLLRSSAKGSFLMTLDDLIERNVQIWMPNFIAPSGPNVEKIHIEILSVAQRQYIEDGASRFNVERDAIGQCLMNDMVKMI